MATGDLQNNLRKLQRDLKTISYPTFDPFSLSKGDPTSLLPLLHYVLLEYSPPLALHLSSLGYDMRGKLDTRFIECVWRVLVCVFGYKPVISTTQFFNRGFAEIKCILVSDVISLVKKFHSEYSANSRTLSHSIAGSQYNLDNLSASVTSLAKPGSNTYSKRPNTPSKASPLTKFDYVSSNIPKTTQSAPCADTSKFAQFRHKELQAIASNSKFISRMPDRYDEHDHTHDDRISAEAVDHDPDYFAPSLLSQQSLLDNPPSRFISDVVWQSHVAKTIPSSIAAYNAHQEELKSDLEPRPFKAHPYPTFPEDVRIEDSVVVDYTKSEEQYIAENFGFGANSNKSNISRSPINAAAVGSGKESVNVFSDKSKEVESIKRQLDAIQVHQTALSQAMQLILDRLTVLESQQHPETVQEKYSMNKYIQDDCGTDDLQSEASVNHEDENRNETQLNQDSVQSIPEKLPMKIDEPSRFDIEAETPRPKRQNTDKKKSAKEQILEIEMRLKNTRIMLGGGGRI